MSTEIIIGTIESRARHAAAVEPPTSSRLYEALRAKLDPLLTEVPAGERESLLQDTFGIVYWLHTDAAEIAFGDLVGLRNGVQAASDIIGPLTDLARQLERLGRTAHREINADLEHSALRRSLIASSTSPNKKKRIASRIATYLCWLFLKSLGVSQARLHHAISLPASRNRMEEIRALEEVSELRSTLIVLLQQIRDLKLSARYHFERELVSSHLARVPLLFAGGDRNTKLSRPRDAAGIALVIARAATRWAHQLRHRLMVAQRQLHRLKGNHSSKPTLDHIHQAIFYLAHAWEGRTGQPATRKQWNDATVKRKESRGIQITPDDANTSFERFINAALGTMLPFNKREVPSPKPYDAQISKVLAHMKLPALPEWI